jgi:hypothetical protein
MIVKYKDKDIIKGSFSDAVIFELVGDYCIKEKLEFDKKYITIVMETEKEFFNQRSVLLTKGTLTQDKRFYFTERTAEKFVMDYSSLEDDEKLVWRDTSKNIVELTKAEAKPYVMEIKTVLRKVYGLLE